ncbi:MAG: hypothetical protein O7H41_00475, partial [Planctomycetota bacterium]|nr:hypothetical protein [Planctomycetota bacterium]
MGRALESFDPVGGAWQVHTPPAASAAVATAETDGIQLYAFGDSIEIYDPALDSWSSQPFAPWPTPVSDVEMDSTASGTTIYVASRYFVDVLDT